MRQGIERTYDDVVFPLVERFRERIQAREQGQEPQQDYSPERCWYTTTGAQDEDPMDAKEAARKAKHYLSDLFAFKKARKLSSPA